MEPVHLPNLGNSCWAASLINALRSLRNFSEGVPLESTLGKALNQKKIPVLELYKWCRECLHNGSAEGKDQDPEDPAEFLVTLFDKEQIPTQCFENTRTKTLQCSICQHERTMIDKEKILIISQLNPLECKPVQQAIYREFGYNIQTYTPPSINIPAASAEQAAEARDAPTNHLGKIWWRCDDNCIQICSIVKRKSMPYILFYTARNKRYEFPARSSEAPQIQSVAPRDSVEIQCEGSCGRPQKHNIFVSNYETNKALIVHITCPQAMELGCLERTLLDNNQVPYDLTAVLCKVSMAGNCHYITYRRQCL